METLKSKIIVLGPNGPVRNPNVSPDNVEKVPSTSDVDWDAPIFAKRREKGTVSSNNPYDKDFLMDSVSMAVEIAKTKAETQPGRIFHVLKTIEAYQSEVKPPAKLDLNV